MDKVTRARLSALALLIAAFPDDARRIGKTDGFAIRRRGDDLYLFGTKPRASVYAVASLLEENTDLIWARPSEDFGTVFTQRPTLALDKTDILDIPAFEYHGWNVVAIRGDWPTAKWVVRNRMDSFLVFSGADGKTVAKAPLPRISKGKGEAPVEMECPFTPPEGAVWVRVWIYDGTIEYVRITAATN